MALLFGYCLMISTRYYALQDWDDFYSDESPTTIVTDGKYKGTFPRFYGSVYCTNCIFKDMISYDFSCLTIDNYYNILIESTIFDNCNSENNPGAIQFYTKNHVLNKVCGYNCTSDEYDSFCYLELGSPAVPASKKLLSETNEVQKSIFELTSVASCESTYCSIDQFYGQIIHRYSNISNNKCSYVSGMYCLPEYDMEDSLAISFSSIIHNIATQEVCLAFGNENNGNFLLNYTNIVYNSQLSRPVPMILTENPFRNRGLIIVNRMVLLKGCNIFNNTCSNNLIFDVVNDGQFIFTDCMVSDDQFLEEGSKINESWLNTENIGNNMNPISNTFIYLNLGRCNNAFKEKTEINLNLSYQLFYYDILTMILCS